jgi:hypothetical protein
MHQLHGEKSIKANRRSGSDILSRFLWKLELINVHKTPPLGPLLNYMNPDHMFTAHSCTLHLISLPYPPYVPQLASSLKIFLRKL